MSFSLKLLQTEETEVFSTKEILELLGDPINDEIQIKGKAFRLSSFEGLGAEDFALSNLTFNEEEQLVPAVHNNQFILEKPYRPDAIMVFVNGVYYRHGVNKAFHIHNNLLMWHGPIDLSENDVIVIRFLDYIP